jgi:hypothetical protein
MICGRPQLAREVARARQVPRCKINTYVNVDFFKASGKQPAAGLNTLTTRPLNYGWDIQRRNASTGECATRAARFAL